jgi:hypothetical protein
VTLKVRRAEINDLDQLVEFTAAEAREADPRSIYPKISQGVLSYGEVSE